eukprot:6192810-Pleurochrysis_carterae.AAC.4
MAMCDWLPSSHLIFCVQLASRRRLGQIFQRCDIPRGLRVSLTRCDTVHSFAVADALTLIVGLDFLSESLCRGTHSNVCARTARAEPGHYCDLIGEEFLPKAFQQQSSCRKRQIFNNLCTVAKGNTPYIGGARGLLEHATCLPICTSSNSGDSTMRIR